MSNHQFIPDTISPNAKTLLLKIMELCKKNPYKNKIGVDTLALVVNKKAAEVRTYIDELSNGNFITFYPSDNDKANVRKLTDAGMVGLREDL